MTHGFRPQSHEFALHCPVWRQSAMAGREPVLERKLLTHLMAAMPQEEDHSIGNPSPKPIKLRIHKCTSSFQKTETSWSEISLLTTDEFWIKYLAHDLEPGFLSFLPSQGLYILFLMHPFHHFMFLTGSFSNHIALPFSPTFKDF